MQFPMWGDPRPITSMSALCASYDARPPSSYFRKWGYFTACEVSVSILLSKFKVITVNSKSTDSFIKLCLEEPKVVNLVWAKNDIHQSTATFKNNEHSNRNFCHDLIVLVPDFWSTHSVSPSAYWHWTVCLTLLVVLLSPHLHSRSQSPVSLRPGTLHTFHDPRPNIHTHTLDFHTYTPTGCIILFYILYLTHYRNTCPPHYSCNYHRADMGLQLWVMVKLLIRMGKNAISDFDHGKIVGARPNGLSISTHSLHTRVSRFYLEWCNSEQQLY